MPKMPKRPRAVKKNNKKNNKKKISLGKKIGGGAKTGMQKLRAAQKAALKSI